MLRLVLAALACAAASGALAGINTWTPVGPEGGYVGSVRHLDGDRLIINSRKHLYMSNDNGASWAPVHTYATYLELPRTIAVSPLNAQQFYVGAADLYRSPGGAFGLEVVNPFAIGPTTAVEFSNDGAVVWHGTSGGGVFRSTNGEFFEARLSGLEGVYPNPILDIEVDATDHDVAYVLTPVGSFKTINGGASWSPMTTPAPLVQMSASRLAANTFIAVRGDNRHAVVTSNGGSSFTAAGSDPIQLLKYAPGIADRVLAITIDRRVLRSDNHGQSWTQVGLFPLAEANDISISPTNSSRIMVATRFGMVGSNDGGATWTVRNSGIFEAHHLAVLNSGQPANRMFLLSGDHQTIYRRESDGAWSGVGSAAASQADFAPGATAIVSPSDPAVLYLVRGGSLARSNDAGVSWLRLGSAPVFDRLAFSRSSPLLGFASGAGLGTHRTIDGGASWSPIDALPHDCSALLVDPVDSNIVYAGTREGAPAGTAIAYKSVDGGVSWLPIGGQVNGTHARQIVFHPETSNTLYLLTGVTVWRSTDSGATWSALSSPYVHGNLIDLEIDPRNPDVMYAVGADRTLAYRSPDGGIAWESFDFPNFGSPETSSALRLVPGTPSKLILTRNHSGAHEMDIAVDLSIGASVVELDYGVNQEVRLSVSFQGNYAPTRTRIEAMLPTSSNGYEIEPRGAACSITGKVLTCQQNQRFRLSGVSVTLRFIPSVPGEQLTAQASAYEPDPNSVNNAVLIGAERIADLESRLEGPATLTVGSTGIYTLSFVNHGPGLTNSVIRGSFDVPSGLEFVREDVGGLSCSFVTGTVRCTAGILNPGTTGSATITLRAVTAGTYSLLSTVREDSPADQNVANDNDTLAVTVAAAPPPASIGGGSGGGGGGGGRFDYLLLALLTLYTIRTASLRRRLPLWASALKKR